MVAAIPDTVYHYCSIETFFSIITTKKLWLTYSNNTNDYLENRWIDTYINGYVRQNLNDTNKDLFQKVLLNYQINKIPTFICCFSEDGDMLSQWRAYANDGLGVSIGFNVKYFMESHNIRYGFPYATAAINKSRSISLNKIIYDKATQKQKVEEIFSNLSDINDTYYDSVALPLAKLAYIFKSPSFYEEKEWRIIHTPLLFGDRTSKVTSSKGMIVGSISDCCFRYTSSTISPYFTLPIYEKENNVHPINEIIIGPKSKLERDCLMMFLEENKFWGISVKNSEIPYR